MKFRNVRGAIKSRLKGSKAKPRNQEPVTIVQKSITEIPPESGFSLLLSLPPEIRLVIYEYLLISKRPNKEILYTGPWEKADHPTVICLSILSVCQQINDEAK